MPHRYLTSPGAKGKKKWEGKRERRQHSRVGKTANLEWGPRPLAEPIEIASRKERDEAANRGNMVFFMDGQRIELPLRLQEEANQPTLQGVYSVSGKGVSGKELISFRHVNDRSFTPRLLMYSVMPKTSEEIPLEKSFFWTEELGHMMIHQGVLRGRGIGLKGASKAERHARAKTAQNNYSMPVVKRFVELYQRLGYEPTWTQPSQGTEMIKYSKFQPKDDLTKYHRIEAIDPRTGKVRTFTFEIGGSEVRRRSKSRKTQ